MPAEPNGWVVKLGKGKYGFRWYDESGRERQRSPFRTQSEARAWGRETMETVRAARRRQAGGIDPSITLNGFVDRYLAQRERMVEAGKLGEATVKKQRWALSRLVSHLGGDAKLRRISVAELDDFEAGESEDVLREAKRLFAVATRRGYFVESPARFRVEQGASNEKHPFESWEHVLAFAGEFRPIYRAIPVFAVATGLRPAEWRALERRDVDLAVRIVRVERELDKQNMPKEYPKAGKSRKRNSRRTVPLSDLAYDTLRDHLKVHQLGSKLLFPNTQGGYINLHNWRRRDWNGAIESAGVEPGRTPYDLRHTFATFALRAGMNTFQLARLMGTSVEMIERHYGHLAADSKDHLRGLLNAFEAETLNHSERTFTGRRAGS